MEGEVTFLFGCRVDGSGSGGSGGLVPVCGGPVVEGTK